KVKWINCAFLKRFLGNRGMRWAARMIRSRYRPDLCFVFFHDLPLLLMQEFSEETPTVIWMEELGAKTDPRVAGGALLDYVRQARLICLSTPDLVTGYRDLGIENSTFLMSGFSPAYHRPSRWSLSGRYDRDLAFIGGPGYMGDRPAFLSRLAEHHDLEIFGLKDSWLPSLRNFSNLRVKGEVRPRGYARVCARSRIVVGLNQSHDHWLYFSNRIYLTLACRGFHLTHYVPGMEEVFGDGVHLAWFKDFDECLDKISYYLSHERERHRIAQAGSDLVLREHRYEHRVADILAILRKEKAPFCPVGHLHEAGLAKGAIAFPTKDQVGSSSKRASGSLSS
ncbi:MAG: glycosyltransferase, partial [Planctomycetota bacterium]